MKQSGWSQEMDLIEAIEAGVRSDVLREYAQDTCTRVLMLAFDLTGEVLRDAREWQRLLTAGGCEVHVVTAAEEETANACPCEESTPGVFVYRAPTPSYGSVETGGRPELMRLRLAALGSLVLATQEPVALIHAQDPLTAEAAEWLAETSRIPLLTMTMAEASLSGALMTEKRPIRS